MQENWNAVIAPTMFEGARAICLGTRFRHDDIHATTFNEQNNWMQIVLPAIKNNRITGEEESYWPAMWSLEYLKEKKRQAPIAFSFQYMNQIVRQNELSLAPELIVKAEIANNVLLLTSETYSKHIHEKDKGNRTIFGDAAAATLISTDGFAEILNFTSFTNGDVTSIMPFRTSDFTLALNMDILFLPKFFVFTKSINALDVYNADGIFSTG
jgi:hypothetical protein